MAFNRCKDRCCRVPGAAAAPGARHAGPGPAWLMALALALAGAPVAVVANAGGAHTAARAASAPAPAPAPRALAPVDEAVRDADFFAFRARLQAALARRDVSALRSAVHPHVRNGFGGDDGAAAFMRRWQPQRRDSRLWETLAAALALGGSFTGPDGFAAPYVYSAWPQDIDAFGHVALLGPGVPVHAAPAAAAPVLAALDNAIVPLAVPLRPEAAWVAVRLPDGRSGHVARARARSPVEYRALFNREGGRWRLTALVAGD